MLAKLLNLVKTYQADIVLAIAIVLITVTSFNLGKISASSNRKLPITTTQPWEEARGSASGLETEITKTSPVLNTATLVVASKASKSKVYHYPWCSSGSNIAEKNKITFESEAAAIATGYTLAGNCKK